MLLPENAHDQLFCPATLMLGEIHWHILRAANILDTRRNGVTPVQGGPFGFGHPNRTEFGKEVGSDEINWWVFKKETEIDKLRLRTRRALDAAQLLQGAVEIKNQHVESYDELLASLQAFANQHAAEIESLHEYVRWLATRDIIAPCILFTYRVWGSTPKGDRTVEITAEFVGAEDTAMIRELTQIVLGIRNAMHYTYDRTYCDIGQEIADSADPEDAAEDRVIEVPVEWVIARTVRETYGECATYFTCLRDSLRNILLDADKCVEQRALIFSDAFWRKFILKAVQTKKTETLLWDFKQTLTMWEVRNDQERARAKVRVAEDVASLANARGGVLIIGVRDQPREIVGLGPIREIENRLMVANQVIVRHVEYDRELVSFRQVVIPGNGEIVCLVVVVAQVPLRGKQSRLK